MLMYTWLLVLTGLRLSVWEAMKIEALPSSSSYTDDDQMNLKYLLEAFGSVVSLEDIASAYCESGKNLDSTAEKLCSIQSSSTETSLPKSTDNTASSSSRCPSNKPDSAHISTSKPKKSSASMGTVSDVIGKNYIKPRTQSDGVNQKLKPVKINSDDFPVSEIWDEKRELATTSRNESMDSDIQEFLCKILGDGFKLEMSVIQGVIGKHCWLNTSIDKLIDLSAATLEKSDDVIGIAAANVRPASCKHLCWSVHLSNVCIRKSNTDVNRGDEPILPQADTKKKDIQREVLEALFSVPDRFEEKESTGPVRRGQRSAHGRVVSKPLEETIIEDFTYITRQPVNERSDEANQTYEDLRTAVMEYWVMMKEYYKASVDAYTRKDYENAQKLLEEVVVGTNGEDKKDGRRKRLITKLLEKEGIPWTEEGNGWIISVRRRD
ncbi:hypothetical protein DH2020_011671 [Rehmannia glutinosa]|uniref:At5g58720/SDE5-like UBA-like domain-containing protein n=1 Tax=Rehmannia glutinosa TaxID=99300 RepID=A0ABR0XEM4_REHGL